MTMRDSIPLRTITRRSTVLNSTSHIIAMRTPDCLLDGTMPRKLAHLTMVADPDSMADLLGATEGTRLPAISSATYHPVNACEQTEHA